MKRLAFAMLLVLAGVVTVFAAEPRRPNHPQLPQQRHVVQPHYNYYRPYIYPPVYVPYNYYYSAPYFPAPVVVPYYSYGTYLYFGY
jgi:hypothetical protein